MIRYKILSRPMGVSLLIAWAIETSQVFAAGGRFRELVTWKTLVDHKLEDSRIGISSDCLVVGENFFPLYPDFSGKPSFAQKPSRDDPRFLTAIDVQADRVCMGIMRLSEVFEVESNALNYFDSSSGERKSLTLRREQGKEMPSILSRWLDGDKPPLSAHVHPTKKNSIIVLDPTGEVAAIERVDQRSWSISKNIDLLDIQQLRLIGDGTFLAVFDAGEVKQIDSSEQVLREVKLGELLPKDLSDTTSSFVVSQSMERLVLSSLGEDQLPSFYSVSLNNPSSTFSLNEAWNLNKGRFSTWRLIEDNLYDKGFIVHTQGLDQANPNHTVLIISYETLLPVATFSWLESELPAVDQIRLSNRGELILQARNRGIYLVSPVRLELFRNLRTDLLRDLSKVNEHLTYQHAVFLDEVLAQAEAWLKKSDHTLSSRSRREADLTLFLAHSMQVYFEECSASYFTHYVQPQLRAALNRNRTAKISDPASLSDFTLMTLALALQTLSSFEGQQEKEALLESIKSIHELRALYGNATKEEISTLWSKLDEQLNIHSSKAAESSSTRRYSALIGFLSLSLSKLLPEPSPPTEREKGE